MLRNKKKKKLGHGNWEETFYVTCNMIVKISLQHKTYIQCF